MCSNRRPPRAGRTCERNLPVRSTLLVTSLAVAACALAGSARAGSIDFETVPGGAPAELLPIGDQYLATEGISFSLEGGGLPVLAQVGSPAIAFQGPPGSTVNDTPAPGALLGNFFLTDDGTVENTPPPLRITFALEQANVAGVLIDVDTSPLGYVESFLIEARDAADQVLDTLEIIAGLGDTGDGVATAWGFNRAANDIASILITYTGPPDIWVGWALDNLLTARIPAPEPGTLLLVAAGVGALASRRARRA